MRSDHEHDAVEERPLFFDTRNFERETVRSSVESNSPSYFLALDHDSLPIARYLGNAISKLA